MVTNQSTLTSVGETRSIEEIRKSGLDNQLKERIAAERAEMQRLKDQAKERLPGQFTSLRQDKETRTFLFTGQWQKLQVPGKDFVSKQEILGKMVKNTDSKCTTLRHLIQTILLNQLFGKEE